MSDEPTEIKVKLDLSLLKFDDLDTFFDVQEGKAGFREALALIKKCIVGGTADLPMTAVGEVMRQFREQAAAMMNPADESGKV